MIHRFRLAVLALYGVALVAWAAIILAVDDRSAALPWALLFAGWCVYAIACPGCQSARGKTANNWQLGTIGNLAGLPRL